MPVAAALPHSFATGSQADPAIIFARGDEFENLILVFYLYEIIGDAKINYK